MTFCVCDDPVTALPVIRRGLAVREVKFHKTNSKFQSYGHGSPVTVAAKLYRIARYAEFRFVWDDAGAAPGMCGNWEV